MDSMSWSRSVPVRYTADVAVIGGGIAGAAAACAAAKSGARVLLAERFAVAGGNMTSGGVSGFCGETAGQGEVFDEITDGLLAFGAIGPYAPYGTRYDPVQVPGGTGGRHVDTELLAVVLQEILLRRGVTLLLHTRFVDVIVEDGSIKGVVVCGMSGPEIIQAKQFIDCTGEGQVAHACGYPTEKGREEDGLQLPMSFKFYIREMEESQGTRIPEGWFEPIRSEDELPMVSPNKTLYPGRRAVKVKIPMYDSTDTESMTAAEIRARRRAMQVIEYFRRVNKEYWQLEKLAPIIGIREGRRIVGDYVLTLEDLRAGRRFPDAIARGVFYLDGHKPDDDGRTYILREDERYVPPYQIPFGSLVAKNGTNLFMAGRCMSADQLALSSARVATTCAMTGQAAGIAAAIAADRNIESHVVDGVEVRRTVEQRGARLEG